MQKYVITSHTHTNINVSGLIIHLFILKITDHLVYAKSSETQHWTNLAKFFMEPVLYLGMDGDRWSKFNIKYNIRWC